MSVPDPVSAGFSPAEEAAWYARLPTMFAAAAALFTSADGRVLLVKPNYRDHWSRPGGIKIGSVRVVSPGADERAA